MVIALSKTEYTETEYTETQTKRLREREQKRDVDLPSTRQRPLESSGLNIGSRLPFCLST